MNKEHFCCKYQTTKREDWCDHCLETQPVTAKASSPEYIEKAAEALRKRGYQIGHLEASPESEWEKQFDEIAAELISKFVTRTDDGKSLSVLKDFVRSLNAAAYQRGAQEARKHYYEKVDREAYARGKETMKKAAVEAVANLEIDPSNKHTPYWQLGGARLRQSAVKAVQALPINEETK